MAAEAAALLVVVPFTFWLASREQLPPLARMGAFVLASATLIVDGMLLASYARR